MAIQILTKQYQKAIKLKHDYIQFNLIDNNVFNWILTIENIKGENNEFDKGQYLLEIKVPLGFPFEPPQFKLLTPNGVYAIKSDICISIGHYHAENYIAILGIVGFSEQIVNGLICYQSLGEGIGLLNTTINEKIKFANDSCDYNKLHYSKFLKN